MPDEPTNRPSLLTLLTDDDPGIGSESHVPGGRASDLEDALAVDLSDLLNSRLRCVHWNERSSDKAISINYGLPDFSGADLNSTDRPLRVAEWIRTAIAENEPRLKNVSVEHVPSASNIDRRLVFRITGTIAYEPFDRVSFSSRFESSTGTFGIASSDF